MTGEEMYKKCKYNTSDSATFVGYCALYMNEDRTAGKLVECSKCPCDKFELELDENNLLVE